MLKTAPASSDSSQLPERTFERIRKLIYDRAGIDLRQGKQTLVAARLTKVMRESGSPSYDDYLDRVMHDKTGDSLVALIDVLTTNYTFFMREPEHFQFLRKEILPNLPGRFDIWCAAASTGEEPYSLACTVLDELGPEALKRCRILATDISTRALAKANEGVYPMARLTGVTGEWRSRYMERMGSGDYRFRAEVRRMIHFRRLNLIEHYPHSGPFSLISCRNVMIYFDRITQEGVVNRMSAQLAPGAHLFIGHAESLNSQKHSLRFVKPAIYQRPAATEVVKRWI